MVGKKKSERQTYDVTPEEFVRVWESSKSAREAAERLKMPKPIVLARASSYRKLGINMKAMRRERKNALNVAELNKIIEELHKHR
jgi:hypothetical protein